MYQRYVSTVYDPLAKPYTAYPRQLVQYLLTRFNIEKRSKLLEIGVGRCEFFNSFAECGLDVSGVDRSVECLEFTQSGELHILDIESQPFPLCDDVFDIVFSKSLIEHLQTVPLFLAECKRVLKPGGLLIVMTPDWEANYKIFFDDITHKTPFTKVTLLDSLIMSGFNEVVVEQFRQLPLVWKYPSLNYACDLIAPFVHVRCKNKFLRWSRELQLLGYARK